MKNPYRDRRWVGEWVCFLDETCDEEKVIYGSVLSEDEYKVAIWVTEQPTDKVDRINTGCIVFKQQHEVRKG